MLGRNSALDVAKDRIRYFLYLNGRWRWRPTKTMRDHGFALVTMGSGGPDIDSDGNPAASVDDKRHALRLNAEWDKIRCGHIPRRARTTLKQYPPGSVGDAYQRVMELRKAARLKDKVEWTHEQEARDDWPRAWKWLEPLFGDCDPRTIVPEMFMRLNEFTGEVEGLISDIERDASISERHRTIKVWRALWKKMAGLRDESNRPFCDAGADPSLTFTNPAPMARQAVWSEGEVVRLIKRAIRDGYVGLAALLAVAWDTQLSPIDVRSLTPRQWRRDGVGALFEVARAKTGRSAFGTLSARTERLVVEYLASLDVDLHLDAPIFRTRGRPAGTAAGGKPWAPRPYLKNSLVDDFAEIRRRQFGKDEKRQLQDFRRSGTVEAFLGGASEMDVAAKMANTIDKSERLKQVYNPKQVASVRRADDARSSGRAAMREQKAIESVTSRANVTLLKAADAAKPLK
jgi:hypothetical protein